MFKNVKIEGPNHVNVEVESNVLLKDAEMASPVVSLALLFD